MSDLRKLIELGDPWAMIPPAKAERLGAAALSQVKQHRPLAPYWRWAAVAMAFAFSTALAAVIGYRQAPHVVVVTAPTTAAPLAATADAGVTVAPRPPLPAPSPPPLVTIETMPQPVPLRRPVPKPPAAPVSLPTAERPAPAPACADLAAESELLMAALKQLRVQKDAAAALVTLDAYDERFKCGELADEAAKVRAEAAPITR